MSEVENVVSQEMGRCFGQYDAKDSACVSMCAISKRCKKDKEAQLKPATEIIKEDTEEIQEMNPVDYFLECLKGRFDVKEAYTDLMTAFQFSKNGKVLGTIKILKDDSVLLKAKNAQLILNNGFQSCKQANEIFHSVLLA
jgi:hypothetical protein